MVGQRPQSNQQGGSHPPRLLEVLRGSKGGLKELYKKAESLENLINCIEDFSRMTKNSGVKTSQIRKFYNSVRSLEQKLDKIKLSNQLEERINEQVRIGVLSLKPLLAYAVGRQTQLRDLAEVLIAAINRVYDYEDFKKFVELFQAIVAYHKYHGGE